MSAILTIYPAETQHPHGADPGGRMPAPPIRGRARAFCPVHRALVISASEPSSPTRKTESHMAAMPRIAHEQLQVHQSNWAPAACRRPDCRRHPRAVEPANWLQYGPWSEIRTEAHGNRRSVLNQPFGTVRSRRAERHFLSRQLPPGECTAKCQQPRTVRPATTKMKAVCGGAPQTSKRFKPRRLCDNTHRVSGDG